ncbi:VOC family protein [Demequina rhizosphaerae]|uniref:VOC family protein n=1 Tax=Demequina rhizosphaerae TaxID=1638985 RepID=UPI000786252D|nr:VOC family protein [Demequina rhizosphaerae]
MEFFEPQVILFVEDCERAAGFYARLGFVETFRSDDEAPIKVEMALGGFMLGLAHPEPAAQSHGLEPVTEGDRVCLTLWTDDVESAFDRAVEAGGRARREPHRFRDVLQVAFVNDLDGHPIQLVERVG